MQRLRRQISKSEIWDLIGELDREGLARISPELKLAWGRQTNTRPVHAYRSVDEDVREVLYLRLCGYSQPQVAEILGISQSTVSRRLAKAADQLRAAAGRSPA